MSNKTSDKNVGSIEEDIEILERFKNNEMQRDKLERDNRCGGWKIGDIYKHLELNTAIAHLLNDYIRQKQINEEHKRINGELRERVKELEEKNEHLSNTSDYETISLECIHLEEQLEIANSRIQELEEERNHWHGCFIVAMENSIAKEKVIDVIQEYKDKIEQYNEYRKQGKETDVEYYENIANTIVVQALQKLLEGEK